MCKNDFCAFSITRMLLDMNAKVSHHARTSFPLSKQFTYIDKRCLFLIAETQILFLFCVCVQVTIPLCELMVQVVVLHPPRAVVGSGIFSLPSPHLSLQHFPTVQQHSDGVCSWIHLSCHSCTLWDLVAQVSLQRCSTVAQLSNPGFPPWCLWHDGSALRGNAAQRPSQMVMFFLRSAAIAGSFL